jgi:hypothetical protein
MGYCNGHQLPEEFTGNRPEPWQTVPAVVPPPAAGRGGIPEGNAREFSKPNISEEFSGLNWGAKAV